MDKPSIIKKLEDTCGITINPVDMKEIEKAYDAKKNLINSKETTQQVSRAQIAMYYEFKKEKEEGVYYAEDDKILSLNLTETNIKILHIFSSFKHLEYLDASDCENLNELSFGGGLAHLKKIDISDSKIERLFFQEGFEVLQVIDASRNALKSIEFASDMPSLKSLDLSGNELTEFTIPVIFQNLQYLYLKDNQISNIPEEVLGKEANVCEPIKNYLAALLTGQILNNQAKCIFFGNGYAGKTTISHELRTGEFSREIGVERTHGILINKWVINQKDFPNTLSDKITKQLIDIRNKTGEELSYPTRIELNLWDFGGQEYFHATHRLFLNNNVMYFLVWDRETDLQNEEEGFFPRSYWQKNINHYAPLNTTLYIQNRDIGKATFDYANQKYKLAEYKEEDQLSIQTHKIDITKLKSGIFEHLAGLDYLCEPIPRVYDDIRRELTKTTDLYLSFHDYKTLCQRLDNTPERIMQEEGQIKTLTTFLHNTGSIICYRYEENANSLLRDYIFVDPNKVTETIYQILDKDALEGKGEFKKSRVIDILYSKGNVLKDANVWLALMTEFELIFRKRGDENHLIAPQYLPISCIDLSEKALVGLNNKLSFKVELYYPKFLSRSIISRFISRYGNLAEDFYWKYGIVVHKDKEEALVYCDYKDQKIVIQTKSEASKLLLECFNSLREIDPTEDLEIAASIDAKGNTTIPVNFIKLKDRIDKQRQYIEWKGQEVEVKFFDCLVLRYNDIIKKQKIDMNEIQQLVSKNKIEQALDLLGSKSNTNEVSLLKSRFSSLQRKSRMGTLSSSEENIERNKIVASILALIEEIDETPKDTSISSPPDKKISSTVDVKTILFTSANPSTSAQLDTGKEYRNIKAEIQKGKHRDSFKFLDPQTEVRVADLQRAFNDKPNIVHFSGHGEEDGIVILNRRDKEMLLNSAAAKMLFSPLSGYTKLIILNSCLSSQQAEDISNCGDFYVFGNNSEIEDDAAICFAEGVYLGLSEGKSWEGAYKDGKLLLISEYPEYEDITEAWYKGQKLNW